MSHGKATALVVAAIIVSGTGFIEQGALAEPGFHGSWHGYLCSGPEANCDEESHLRGSSGVFGGADVCDDFEPGAGDLYCQTAYAVTCIEDQEGNQLVQSSFNEGEETRSEWVAVTCGQIGGGGGH